MGRPARARTLKWLQLFNNFTLLSCCILYSKKLNNYYQELPVQMLIPLCRYRVISSCASYRPRYNARLGFFIAVRLQKFYCFINSTLLLVAFPPAVWLVATGLLSPSPPVCIREPATAKFSVRYSFTDAALFCDNFRLSASLPSLSVWPIIFILKEGFPTSASPICFKW